MRNSEELMEKVEKLERMAESVAGEVALLDFCRANGLNFDDRADYAQAEMEVHFSRHEQAVGKTVKSSTSADSGLPLRNRVDSPAPAAYNERKERATTTEEPYASFYGWTSSVRQKLIGRVVINRTGVRIAIAAQPRKAPNTTVRVYLGPGESSQNKYEDVDIIMIAPGQKFYKSKADALALNKEIASVGGIKVRDGITTAVVRHTTGNPTVFYVDASDTIYFEKPDTIDSRWVLP